MVFRYLNHVSGLYPNIHMLHYYACIMPYSWNLSSPVFISEVFCPVYIEDMETFTSLVKTIFEMQT